MDSTDPKDIACIRCGSGRLWKAGHYAKRGIKVQRWLCRDCGLRFYDRDQFKVKLNVFSQSFKVSSPRKYHFDARVASTDFTFKKCLNCFPFLITEYRRSHKVSNIGKNIKAYSNKYCYLNVSEKGKTLRQTEALKAELKCESKFKSDLLGFLWQLKKDGLTNKTIEDYGWLLKSLIKIEPNVNLYDPESVKETLIKLNNKFSQNTVAKVVTVLDKWFRYVGVKWEKPKVRREEVIPYIPTEEEVDALITDAPLRLACILQLLKETGMRVGEALLLKWSNIDFKRKLIRLEKPLKNGRPRYLKVSDKLLNMINKLKRESDNVFGQVTYRGMYSTLHNVRNRLANKFSNERFKLIGFHTIRHWKATFEYHQTKDLVHVYNMLGHRNIKNTMIYVNLEEQIYQTKNDEWIVKVARIPEEIKSLLEVGFEYVCEKDGNLFFKKRK